MTDHPTIPHPAHRAELNAALLLIGAGAKNIDL